jgi:hypothetical protein
MNRFAYRIALRDSVFVTESSTQRLELNLALDDPKN